MTSGVAIAKGTLRPRSRRHWGESTAGSGMRPAPQASKSASTTRSSRFIGQWEPIDQRAPAQQDACVDERHLHFRQLGVGTSDDKEEGRVVGHRSSKVEKPAGHLAVAGVLQHRGRKTLGEKHPHYLTNRLGLANVLRARSSGDLRRENFAAARQARSEALQIIVSLNGEHQWQTGDLRRELAHVDELVKHKEAELLEF